MPDRGSGRCLCGAVAYKIDGPLRQVVACHCSQCRRTSGHHVAATACAREALTIEGAPTWYESSPGCRRGFCGRCGSNLFWDNQSEAHVSIFAGTLDAPTGLRLVRNIYVEDKGDYYDLPTPSAGGDAAAG